MQITLDPELTDSLLDLGNDVDEAPAWLEDRSLGGFRVWQLIFLCLGAALSVIIVICCCFRFRIPRTKQEIEADYQRRKIARKFRDKLARIKNSEMDNNMDLQKALDLVRAEFLVDNKKIDREREQLIEPAGRSEEETKLINRNGTKSTVQRV